MATLITKNSQTAAAVPSAASLSVGELAVNTADGKLYTEHTGGVVKEIIPSTVVDGGITDAKIADNAVTTAKLSNSGVTAGTYGNGSTIPSVTVDVKGRVTSVTTNAVSVSAPTTAQVLSATAGFTSNVVGSFCVTNRSTAGPIALNGTVAGSTLYATDGSGTLIFPMAGTWRLLGASNISSVGYTAGNAILVRIS